MKGGHPPVTVKRIDALGSRTVALRHSKPIEYKL